MEYGCDCFLGFAGFIGTDGGAVLVGLDLDECLLEGWSVLDELDVEGLGLSDVVERLVVEMDFKLEVCVVELFSVCTPLETVFLVVMEAYVIWVFGFTRLRASVNVRL